jgi:hypothetical protein
MLQVAGVLVSLVPFEVQLVRFLGLDQHGLGFVIDGQHFLDLPLVPQLSSMAQRLLDGLNGASKSCSPFAPDIDRRVTEPKIMMVAVANEGSVKERVRSGCHQGATSSQSRARMTHHMSA